MENSPPIYANVTKESGLPSSFKDFPKPRSHIDSYHCFHCLEVMHLGYQPVTRSCSMRKDAKNYYKEFTCTTLGWKCKQKKRGCHTFIYDLEKVEKIIKERLDAIEYEEFGFFPTKKNKVSMHYQGYNNVRMKEIKEEKGYSDRDSLLNRIKRAEKEQYRLDSDLRSVTVKRNNHSYRLEHMKREYAEKTGTEYKEGEGEVDGEGEVEVEKTEGEKEYELV